METVVSETITEEIFRTMYLGMNFQEKSAIDPTYNFKSKKGTDNKGYPDFFKDMKEKDFLIIVECKAERKKHNTAEEEVKFYMSCTNDKYNSVGIAVSGQEIEDLSVSMFIQLKGDKNVLKLNVTTLMSLENIEKLYKETANKTNYSKLIKYSDELNTTFHNLFKITVSKRPFFFAGLLFSLEELSNFLLKYQHEEIIYVNKEGKNETIDFNDETLSDKDKVDFINSIIANQIEIKFKGQLNNKFKSTDIPSKFQFIKTEIKNLSFLEYVSFLKTFTNIFKEYKFTSGYYDVIGTFYSEFLRYVQKAGGQDIVLTPDHIKDLMCDLLNISKNDVVLDICAGSGGFGTVVLNKMLSKTKDDEKDLKNKIKKESIISVEIDDDMYTLAYSNMILHGGGFKNLYKGNSLTNFEIEEDDKITTFEEKIAIKQPNKAIMNPPYNDDAAPEFILRLCNLMCLSGNGTKQIIVIAPSACLRKKIETTKKIFEIAKLKTVIDMNGGLFISQNINVKTSLFIFEVGIEHFGKTYFYDFKNDGYNYSKRKIENLGNFENLKYDLLNSIDCLEILDEKSYIEEINILTFENTVFTPKKEFEINNMDFMNSIIDYSIFELKKDLNTKTEKEKINVSKWKEFSIEKMFHIEKGTRLNKAKRKKGEIPFLTATSENNGISNYIDPSILKMNIKKDAITIDMFFNVFYHGYEFLCDDNVHILYLKDRMINKQLGLFLISALIKNKNKYHYGQQLRIKHLIKETIFLPAKLEKEEYVPDWEFMETYIKEIENKIV